VAYKPLLNDQQKKAVEHIGSPLLVLAGAGTGKTKVITEKIAWLIREANVDAKNIAAITFTNKAAREMKERASSILNKEEAKGLTVSTFHTLGLTIIRKEYKQLGYKAGFTIFDSQDSSTIIKELTFSEAAAENDEDNNDDDVRWIISRWKNDFVTIDKAFEIATNPQEVRAAKLYRSYQRQLKAYNAIDFDDLILLPLQLFRDKPDVLKEWQNKYRYLLVDEYQDTNVCQYELVKLLTGLRKELTVVGDDDQSIYAWRGAKPENIAQLQVDYPNLTVVKLEQNYRSTSLILESANALIANNDHLFTLEKLGNYANERQISLFAASQEMGFAQRVSGKAASLIQGFIAWLNDLIVSSHDTKPHAMVERIVTEIAYEDWLKNICSSDKQAEQRMSNVHEIIDWTRRLYEDGDGKETIGDIISHMCLMDLLERNQEEEEENAISLMTMHTAKGLEFPYVFLVGIEEEILPHVNSMEEDGLEEERRLAYVGITRAKRFLTITYANVRNKYGEKISCEPSRFLEEIPEENCEWADRVVVSKEQMQATSQSYISSLQAMLDE